jgi:MFS transporter, NNP family, nitrate/nitrite transporter
MDAQISSDASKSPSTSPHVLTDWRPDDTSFWEETGKRIATRNLLISIPALTFAFSVWIIWSIVAVRLNDIGFHFSTDQLFWLTALPPLTGATLRIFYSFAVPIFGGRRWTAISTASLLVPTLWLGFAIQDPNTPYPVFVTIALFCGFGGGNFSSSMANISFFFPKRLQGTANGLNAGLGNLGVSAMQFAVPLAISTSLFGAFGGAPQHLPKGGSIWLQNAGFIWVPIIVVCSLAAWFGMNDLATSRASFREQAIIFRRKHTWLMSWLYIGTFGSFIGFASCLTVLIKSQFPGVNPLQYAFLGPLVGALIRPVGGWLSDKLGGALVTFWNFLLMIAAVFGVLYFVGPGHNFFGFLGMFILLFITTGIGNGSTFRMIPLIFRTMHEKAVAGSSDADKEHAIRQGNREAAAVLGFSGAIGAYGGFFIPRSFGTSISMTGRPDAALYGFLIFYATCVLVTFWWYFRKNAEAPC